MKRWLATRWGWVAFLAAETLSLIGLVVALVVFLPNGAAGWAMLLFWLLVTAAYFVNSRIRRWVAR